MAMNSLPHPSFHRSWVEVDLGAITDNVKVFRGIVGPGCTVMPALKADGYGHGLVEAARAALRGGAGRLAVATCMEGERLRDAGIGVPIQVLGASFPEEIAPAVRFNLTLSVHDVDMARLAALAAHDAGQTVTLHLKIDTGMGRLGVLPEVAPGVACEIAGLPNVRFEGIFMHFAEAHNREYSQWQLNRFKFACAEIAASGITGLLCHTANSVASILHPGSRFDLIRPGCGVYGYLSPTGIETKTCLRPAMAWRSSIIHIKDYPPGCCLGYDRTFTTTRFTRIAVLPVGYEDGYRRECSNRAQVLIRGRRAPVVGTISMDYTLVDITEVQDETIDIGTVATMLGRDGNAVITAEELAEWGGTIPYCVTTGIGSRVGRMYVEK